jgi:hypothetical protein
MRYALRSLLAITIWSGAWCLGPRGPTYRWFAALDAIENPVSDQQNMKHAARFDHQKLFYIYWNNGDISLAISDLCCVISLKRD